MTFFLLFLAGLLLGTLLNVIIIRLPRERRLLGWPHCTRTGKPLAIWQLLPVVGWALQRGRARNGQKICFVYPMVEVLTASTLVLLYRMYAFTPLFFYLCFVCGVFIITGAIDWTHRYIYTFVIFGATLFVLGFQAFAPSGVVDVSFDLRDALIGMLIAGFCFVMLFMLARVLFPGKAVPFGLGDVYLGMFIGAAFGLSRLATTLWYGMLMAGVVALVIVGAKYMLKRRDMPEYMPYGAYLCLGAIVYVLINGW